MLVYLLYECIKKEGLSKKFKKQSPNEAKEIEKWMQD